MTEQNGVGRSSAAEILRRMLDERGVEYETETADDGWAFTRWHGFDGTGWTAASDEVSGMLDLRGRDLFTPAQVVAATVGSEGTYTREECEAAFVRGYSLGSLPVGSDPRWDENRQTVDEHMSDLGWVRKDAATVGAGECHETMIDRFFHGCGECGYMWEFMYGIGNRARPNFCPNCGRRVVGA